MIFWLLPRYKAVDTSPFFETVRALGVQTDIGDRETYVVPLLLLPVTCLCVI